mmetsp:Transcript_73398/g.226610  ORF Transcript_73398/g.226610 Transcript_73398/m.226610 type:complete len:236 (+) Transcript_73398:520-1227(+)
MPLQRGRRLRDHGAEVGGHPVVSGPRDTDSGALRGQGDGCEEVSVDLRHTWKAGDDDDQRPGRRPQRRHHRCRATGVPRWLRPDQLRWLAGKDPALNRAPRRRGIGRGVGSAGPARRVARLGARRGPVKRAASTRDVPQQQRAQDGQEGPHQGRRPRRRPGGLGLASRGGAHRQGPLRGPGRRRRSARRDRPPRRSDVEAAARATPRSPRGTDPVQPISRMPGAAARWRPPPPRA